MSRLEIVEDWLIDWARWKARGESHVGAICTEPLHVEVDSAISTLPAPLRETVEECYLRAGDHAVHAERLGCPSFTLTRRLSRAHALLHGGMAEARARRQRTLEAEEMRRRLDAVDAAGRVR